MNERRAFLRKCIEGSAVLSTFLMVGLQLPEDKEKGYKMASYVAGAPHRIGFDAPLNSVFYTGQKLSAVREHNNLHDEAAIALYEDNKKLGYVPRQDNIRLRGILEKNAPVSVTVIKVDNDRPWDGVEVEIYWI